MSKRRRTIGRLFTIARLLKIYRIEIIKIKIESQKKLKFSRLRNVLVFFVGKKGFELLICTIWMKTTVFLRIFSVCSFFLDSTLMSSGFFSFFVG